MKLKDSPSLFSLPLLLSFNELAWITVFALVLAACLAWLNSKDKDDRITNNFQMIKRISSDLDKKEIENQYLRSQGRYFTNLEELSRKLDLTEANLKILQKENRNLLDAKNQFIYENKRLHEQIEDLIKSRDMALSDSRALLSQIQILMNSKSKNSLDVTNIQAVNQRLSNELAAISIEYQNLKQELYNFKKLHQQQDEAVAQDKRAVEGGIRQELLGLKGSMNNVVILLDRSASMKGNRWKSTIDVVESWLKYLPVKRCALITFNTSIELFPRYGMLDVEGITNNNRNLMIRAVRNLEPTGNTDTYTALSAAYSNYPDADTIILFTDGEPYVPPLNEPSEASGEHRMRISRKLQTEIIQLVDKQAKNIPINTVGVGKYYENKELTEFLINLSSRTGGVFLGR